MRTTESLAAVAARVGVDPAALGAVLDVESAGVGLINGLPVIRLEVHKLWDHASAVARPQVDARFHVDGYDPGKPRTGPAKRWLGHRWLDNEGVWRALHQPGAAGQALEWSAYRVASQIDPIATILATSFGLAQILGEHWRDCGFASPESFVAAQYTEDGQIESLAKLIQSSNTLLSALRGYDWPAFALRYNGSGQVDYYAGRLSAAYAKRKAR